MSEQDDTEAFMRRVDTFLNDWDSYRIAPDYILVTPEVYATLRAYLKVGDLDLFGIRTWWYRRKYLREALANVPAQTQDELHPPAG